MFLSICFLYNRKFFLATYIRENCRQLYFLEDTWYMIFSQCIDIFWPLLTSSAHTHTFIHLFVLQADTWTNCPLPIILVRKEGHMSHFFSSFHESKECYKFRKKRICETNHCCSSLIGSKFIRSYIHTYIHPHVFVSILLWLHRRYKKRVLKTLN